MVPVALHQEVTFSSVASPAAPSVLSPVSVTTSLPSPVVQMFILPKDFTFSPITPEVNDKFDWPEMDSDQMSNCSPSCCSLDEAAAPGLWGSWAEEVKAIRLSFSPVTPMAVIPRCSGRPHKQTLKVCPPQ